MSGITHHHFTSLYSFVMGALWFSTFIIIGLLLRRLRFPLKFSTVPLMLLFVLSIVRVSVFLIMPRTIIIDSPTWYPVFADWMRSVVIPCDVFGFPVTVANLFMFLWITISLGSLLEYTIRYFGIFLPFLRMLERSPRDEFAEALLADSIGEDKYFRIYRYPSFSTVVSTAIKPYIILPAGVDIPEENLKVILVHEWKHIQDMDFLSDFLINVVCFAFWWNPLVYLFRKNYRFAREVKCDHGAISTEDDMFNLVYGLRVLQTATNENNVEYIDIDDCLEFFNALHPKSQKEITERLSFTADKIRDEKEHGKSLKRRLLFTVSSSVVIVAIFVLSYFVIILPATWESPYVDVLAECLTEEYQETGGVSAPDEAYLVDNNDGTFSLYIEGQYMETVDSTHEMLNWLPIRQR